MAYGTEIYNLLPNEAYMVVHAVGIVLGAWLAMKAFDMKKASWGYLFGVFAVSELLHELTHLGVTTLPFTHLVQEVLLILALLNIAMEMNK